MPMPHSPAVGIINILVKFWGNVKMKVNKSNLICCGERVEVELYQFKIIIFLQHAVMVINLYMR